MPAYNQGQYVAEAITSVLNQTYQNWELIVVNDGSTDSTAPEVSQFRDERVKYLYQMNRGVSEARNVAIAASAGDYLAFLDADDLWAPGKLETQVAELEQNPALGASYVWRTEIGEDGKGLRFRRATLTPSLQDLVLGFPFAPSDLMVRREWAQSVGNFNKARVGDEDREFFLRLALAGCQFAGLDLFLSYHRFYAGRVFGNLTKKVADMIEVLDSFFRDSRCPSEVLSCRAQAYRNVYIEWAYQAAIVNETSLAQNWFREVVQFDPSILAINRNELLQRLVEAATRDGGEHEARLRATFAQLPAELECLWQYCDWAVGCGYVLRGVRDMMWGRTKAGAAHLNRAAIGGARLDSRTLNLLRYQLLNDDAGLGPDRFRRFLCKLSPYLEKVGGRKGVRRLNGWYSINGAFRDFREGNYARVLSGVTRAVANDARYLSDKQVLSILPRAVLGLLNLQNRWRKPPALFPEVRYENRLSR